MIPDMLLRFLLPVVILGLGVWRVPMLLRDLRGGGASDILEESRTARGHAAWILLLTTLVYFYTSSRSTLWDLDDALNGQVMIEMLATGRTRVPTIDGAPRLEKPPLVYWLAGYPLRVFGSAEWVVRLVSTLGMALACGVTFLWGAWYLSPRAGLLAMLMLSVAPLMILSGSGCTMDALLLALITLAVYWLTHALHRGFTVGTVLGLGGVLGLALLTKGPLGYGVPMLAFGVAWVLSREGWTVSDWVRGTLRVAVPLLVVTILAAGVFLVWLVPANEETGGDLVRVFLIEEHFGRAAQAQEGHGWSNPLMLFFYFPIAVVGFFPFTAYVPGAIRAWAGGRIGTRKTRAMLLGWIVPTILAMSLVKTKLPHYILPVIPGLALLAGATLDAGWRGRLSKEDRQWLAWGWWLLAGLGVAITALLVAIPILARGFGFAPGLGGTAYWLLGAGLVAGMTGWAIRLHRREEYGRSVGVLQTGFLMVMLAGAWLLMPHVEAVKFSPKLGRVIRETVPVEVPVARYVYREPSLSFYAERYAWEDFRHPEPLLAWLEEPGHRMVVMERYRMEAVREEFPERWAALGIREVASKTGFYYNRRGRWTDLLLLERGGAGTADR